MTDSPLASTTGLTVRYRDHLALRDVTATVWPGERIGVIGPNGAGKTTLLRSLVGLVAPWAGEVLAFGVPPRESRRRISYLAQGHPVGAHHPIRVRDVVAMGRYVHRGPTGRLRAGDRDAIDVALERMSLTDIADRKLSSLSGGQQRRTFLARTLAQQADLLLLDEPYAGVDAGTSMMIEQELARVAADGTTVICVDHDLPALARRYGRLLLVRESLRYDGPTAEGLAAERLRETFQTGVVILDGDLTEG